jgi:perosamine synthetase
MRQFIPVNRPDLSGNEKKYLIDCIETGWISSEGPYVEKFEHAIAEMTGRKYAIAVCNGTAALDVAVEALGLKAGDEIIMPTFTIISCINHIIRSGANPVFVDSEVNTWNMDISQIESKISSKTKAIMVVHIYGLPVEMGPVLDLAKKYNLKVIEDAAEMHGQFYLDKPCGSFGDISTMSFYPNKHITTGEGGMVLTDSQEIAVLSKSLRNLCMQENNRFVHERLGWNLRMTNMQAALGLAQSEKIKDFVTRKHQIGMLYVDNLKDTLDCFQLPLEATRYAKNIYWVFGLVCRGNAFGKRDVIVQMLKEHGVATRPFFWPMHEQPVFKKMGLFQGESYPIAENIARNGFYVPSGIGTTDDEIFSVCAALKEISRKMH